MAVGVLLSIYALLSDFAVGDTTVALLCAIGLYIVASDSAIRLLRSLNT